MGALAWLRRHREVITLWALASVFAGACVLLGRWQLHRYQDKHARAQLIEQNQARPPVALENLLPSPSAALPGRARYRAVTVRGTYDVAGTRLVRNRPHRGGAADATFGYEVVVPLVLPDGSAFLVARGWVPNGRSGSSPGSRPDAVPGPPAGIVTVVARLRATEPRRGHDLPAGQVGSVAVPQIAASIGRPTYQAYGAAISETPAPADVPARLDPVRTEGGEGINASYAVQWVAFALLGLGFPWWVIRRRREAAHDAVITGSAAAGATGAPATAPPRPPGADTSAEPAARQGTPVRAGASARTRPRRHHVWDDEDE